MLTAGAKRLLLHNGGFHTFLYVLPLVALLGALTGGRFHERFQAVQDVNHDLARATAVSFRNYLNQLWDMEKALGEAIVETAPPVEVANRLLTRQVSSCPSVRNLIFMDATGRAVAASNRLALDTSWADRDYVRQLLHGREMVVSSLLVGRISKQPTLMVARAIRRGPKVKAIMVATVDVTRLGEALPTRSGNAAIGLIDPQGLLVYQSRIRNIPFAHRKISPAAPAWKALRGEDASSAHVEASADGTTMVGTAVPITELGWAAIAGIARSEALAPAYREAAFAFFGCLLVVGATLLGVALLQRELDRHSSALSQAAASFAEGHYETRVDVSCTSQLATAEAAFNRMAERIQDLEQERLRFIQLTAHELRTPLTSVKGICGLLTRQLQADPQAARLAGILDAEVGHLAGLVDDILNVFLLQEGRITLSLQPLELGELVSAAVQPFAAAEPERFIVQVERTPLTVSGDPRRLRQVLKNILNNAVKYSAPHTPIEVSVTAEDAFAIISVKDKGRGIPADQLHKVFDPFFRASNVEDTWEQSGIGLGLHLCQVVVERHGGRILVESSEGEGATFQVRLPRLDVTGRDAFHRA